jgi:hypothetical protein
LPLGKCSRQGGKATEKQKRKIEKQKKYKKKIIEDDWENYSEEREN